MLSPLPLQDGRVFFLMNAPQLQLQLYRGRLFAYLSRKDWFLQNIVSSNPQIAYSSIHEFPFYPGTGSQIEKGDYGNVMNVPISSNLNSLEYRKEFDEKIFPFLNNFKPDILIISSGFDAHKNDPLANINLEAEDYSYMTKRCLEIQPHIMLGLEGGYDFKALEECTLAVVRELILIN